jgi:DNA-binding XRE family transcriptional regulator
MTIQTLTVDDKELVVLTREAFDDLMEKAGVLPAYPPVSDRGGYPASKTLHISIARSIISARIRAGLTQKELARRSGVRLETICRIEGGKQKPVQETVMRLEAALLAARRGESASQNK